MVADAVPGLALLGSGIFASTQYVPKLGELGDLVSLKTIWSRSEHAAKKALLLAKSYAPNVEAKWGQEGLESIFQDKSIHAVAVVLPAQYQLDIVLRALEAGKHVIQEKPVGPSVADVRKAWSAYRALATNNAKLPIWAVAENYRFEPALIQGLFRLSRVLLRLHVTGGGEVGRIGKGCAHFKTMDTKMEEVKQEIRKVQEETRKAQQLIGDVTAQVTTIATEGDVACWRKENEHLWENKLLLHKHLCGKRLLEEKKVLLLLKTAACS